MALNYRRLSPMARMTIKDSGLTIAEYVREAGRWADGDWHGDTCGCTDDRCIGYHHDEHEECGCLPVLIEEALGWVRPAPHPAPEGGMAFPNGNCIGQATKRPPGSSCIQCGWTAPTP